MSPKLTDRGARVLAGTFAASTLVLAAALAGTWIHIRGLMLQPVAAPPLARPQRAQATPVTPVMLQYQLDLPGRGEIFPAMATASNKADYWPVAILNIANNADAPVAQTIVAEVPGWSRKFVETVVIGPRETRTLHVNPELLPKAYGNHELRRGTLEVRSSFPTGTVGYAQSRPVLLHGVSDLYWGKRFANAQFVARWVTPHDPAVLKLVSAAKKYVPNGRMAGYISSRSQAVPGQVRAQAQAIFKAMQRSGISYVSSIYTFGSHINQAQRIRLPRETLALSTANCMDVSVTFASAMENLGMHPVLVIVPGHAFVGVRLGPQSNEVLYLDLTVLPKGSFQQAIARAENWRKKFPADRQTTVDVTAARALGIFPIPSTDATLTSTD